MSPCPIGEKGEKGYTIKTKEEFLFRLSRLSTSGKLEEVAEKSICRMYPVLIPYFDDWDYTQPLNPEKLMRQIVEQPLVKRYMTPWERALTIVLRHPEAVDWR